MTKWVQFDGMNDVLVARAEVSAEEQARREAIAVRSVARRVSDPAARAEVLEMLGLVAAAAALAA